MEGTEGMEELLINGVKVLFPFKPYAIQVDYMKSVIQCLQQKSNGLLESPTGTGKTLCILCATLGWVDSQNVNSMRQMVTTNGMTEKQLSTVTKSLKGWALGPNNPQILYSSRTHQQLSQACSELKRTAYNNYKAVVIGSRDQLCLNSDVSRLESISAKNQSCRHKIQNNLCAFYRNYEQKVERNVDYNATQVFDIEDLVKLGKRNTCCPYYASRYLRTKALLVFTPYNYILDPQIRLSNALEVKNSVVIFDEGHNIEKMCEESVSSELRSETFAVCIKHINSVLEKLKDINDGSYDGMDAKELSELEIERVAKLKLTICDLESAIDLMIKDRKSNKSVHETKVIFDLMERVGLDVSTCMEILDIMDKISMTLTNSNTLAATQALVVSTSFTTLAQFLERLIPIKLSTLEEYESHKIDFIKKFKIFSERGAETDNQSNSFWNKKSSPDSWVLNIWCLSPSVGAKSLLDLGIHSLIITSGTLAPINSFEAEMELKFAVKLQNSHIIEANQLSILNISNARDNTVLTSKYDNRDNMQYYRALGQTLIDILTVVPKGVLIFFSSYTALNKCVNIWKQNDNFWVRLNCVKQIFLEPRNKRTFSDCIMQYKCKIDESNSNGAVFFGVCRGKLSEGMDLPDDYCRGVIMTGLPFPAVADPRVILKKQYLSEVNIELTANGWYSLQMKRALNQAIGRVVRHKDDFGVIILLDSRFATLNDGLSKWVEKFISRNRFKNLDESLAKLKSFFSNKNSNYENFSLKTSDSSLYTQRSKLTQKPFNSQFKSFSNNFQKSAINPTNRLKDGTTILNAFKSIEKVVPNLKPESKSIFDSMFGIKSTSKPNICVNSCVNSAEIISLDPSPQKRIKLNVPLKCIDVTTPTEPKTSTPINKLQGIIKSKPLTDSTPSKRVHWNEERNTVHELKPIALQFTDESTSDHKTVVPSKVMTLDFMPVSDNCVEKPVAEANEATERLLEFWRKNGAQLKELLKGTNGFGKICEGIREFKKFKNILTLSVHFNIAFKKIDKQIREQWIRELSIIVPKAERHVFLEKCFVKTLSQELEIKKEFNVIERKDNNNLIPKTHFCMICKSESAVSPHRTLCCGYVACLKCFKRSKHLNRSNKCLNCDKPLKISDLKHLRFCSAFL